MIHQKIDFNIWISVIDTHHQYHREYIHSNRNKAFSSAMKVLVEKYISANNTINRIYIDQRLKNEIKYSLVYNGEDIVKYTTSHTNYGIQLADLLGGVIRQKYEYPRNIQYIKLYDLYIEKRILGISKDIAL